MSNSTIGAYAGWKVETTQNTRAAPDKFVGLLQESLREDTNIIEDEAIYAGRRLPVNFSLGERPIGGAMRQYLQAETIVTMLQCCVGGSVVTTGAGPYTHTLTPGDLPTATIQKVMPGSGGTDHCFEYVGSMVNSWSITQNSGQRAEFQVDLFSYDEDTGQTASTATYDAAPTFFTFRHLAVTIGGDTFCPDSLTLSGANDIDRNYKSCSTDAGRATIRERSSKRAVTLSIPRDFPDLGELTKRKAGTEVAVSVGWTSGTSSLTLTGNGYLMGSTPTIGGQNQLIKETLDIRLMDASSDADAMTIAVVNDEATA